MRLAEVVSRKRPINLQAITGGPGMRSILLLLPCILALAVPFYNRMEPELFGFPFFYWFHLLLVPVTVAFIYAASKLGGRP